MQKPLAPPRAERRPVTATHHGHARTDDYAWLRAENWQEVMRNPAALPADIRAYLEAENAYFARGDGRHRGAAGDALQGDARAHQGGRFDRPRARRPLGLRRALHRGRPASAATCAGRATAAPRRSCCSTAMRSPRAAPISASAAARMRPTTSCSPGRTTMPARSSTRCRCATLTTGHDLADVIPDTGGSAVWSADGRSLFYVRLDANHRPVARLPPHDRHRAARTTCSSTRSPIPASSSASARRSRDRFIVIHSHDHETSEVRLIPADAPGGDADARRAARRPPSNTASTRRTARSSS